MSELIVNSIEYILTIEKPSIQVENGPETILTIEMYEDPDTVLVVHSGEVFLEQTELEMIPLNLPYGMTLLTVEVGSPETPVNVPGTNYGVVTMYDPNYPETEQEVLIESGRISQIQVRDSNTDNLLFERLFVFDSDGIIERKVTTDFINDLEYTEEFIFGSSGFTKNRSLVSL